ncbi:hypothetical protein ACGFIV_25165 [Sphaerisporangium sp. NPDC049003]|uniref:hypothetical protein n=1 Tax=Sphaerisporangium sp. NPDC049003 TaxID=3364517 RepID=UPI00371E1F0A
MTATLELLGWRAQGLRCPDHEIDCRDEHGDVYSVSLVQMPNGTGKTTTLTLLRAALSGSLDAIMSQLTDFQKRETQSDYGAFEVRLRLNGRLVTIILRFDFENRTIGYWTTQGPGQMEGFEPPAEFRRFLNSNFVKFFVFDGELAQELLDPAQVKAEEVIETLFQINSLHNIRERVSEYWERQTRTASATDTKALSRRRNKVTKERERLAFVRQERDKTQNLLQSNRLSLEAKQQAYNQQIQQEAERGAHVSAATARVDALKHQVRDSSQTVLERMRDPHALSSHFAQSMADLKTALDRVKLPESAAREFFEELAQEAECICGRHIDDVTRTVILERAGHYLGSDDMAFLNSMKTAIQDSLSSSDEEALLSVLDELDRFSSEYRQARNELEALLSDAEESDPAVKEASLEIEESSKRISRLEDMLQQFSDKNESLGTDETWGIEVLEKRVKTSERLLAEISDTIDLKRRRDILNRILLRAHEKARSGIMAEICSQANERITELMPHNRLTIERVDKCLVLKGQSGGSVGENLSVAYAFLATLFNRSEHALPFIVDSPAGAIDLAVRPRVGELIPRLTRQFIAFTISSEREKFVSSLEAAATRRVQYTTLYRRREAATSYAESGNHPDAILTGDGIMVFGREFFNSFQMEEDE